MELSVRNLDAPPTSNTTGSRSDSAATPRARKRTSRLVRESAMSAIIYNQGRRRGSQETEMALRQQYEDLDRKFLADLEREREEQRRTVDKIRSDHRTEATITSLTAQRHVDGARMATRKYQVALDKECEQSARKLMALTLMHEQERQQMKEEHEYKVDHLYGKISKLVAEKTDDQDTVRREYESALEQKQAYVETLEQKLQAAEESLEGRGAMDTSTARVNGEEKAPFVDQMRLVQQLRQTNAEQANLILGLQASLSNLGRQLTDAKASLAHACSGQPSNVYSVSHPRYRERSSQGNFTPPPPTTYPQQASQQTNGLIPQHMLPHVFPYQTQTMNGVHHDGNMNSAPQRSHGSPLQATGNHISKGPEGPAFQAPKMILMTRPNSK
ncbi:MAG: hypothetical protein Q9213_003555 [Squamulea squamosa]